MWRLGLVASVAVVLIYHLMFFSRFFPVQEGWFTAYAHLMLQGRVPYRDFYLFVQPVYPLLVTAVVKVAGYDFIAIRVLGLVERLGLAAILYVLLARAFRPVTAFVACVTAIVLYASNTTDVISSYLQICLVLSLVGVYCVLRALEAETPAGSVWWALAAGLAQSLAFFTKQTTGALVPMVVVVVAAVTVWREPRRGIRMAAGYAAGWAVPTVVITAWLAGTGALAPYVGQVYGGAASKGPLLSVLGGVLQRSVTAADVRAFAVLCAGGIGWVALARWTCAAVETDERSRRLRVSLLAAAAAGLAVWWFMLYERYRWPVAALVITGLAAYVAASRLSRDRPAAAAAAVRWLEGPAALAVVAAAAATLLWSPLVASGWLWARFLSLHFLSLKELVVSWSLFAAVGLAVYWLVRSVRDERPQRAWVLALCAATGAAVEYAHGMSYEIEIHAVVPALAVALGALLEWRLPGRVVRITVLAAVIALTLALCAGQRYVWPYQWWGWREPSVSRAVIQPQEPLLAGFRLSPYSEDIYRKVDAALRGRVDHERWLYCFPNVAMFYVTTGVYPKTHALVAYWDVCPDDVAVSDAAILLRDPPAAIVDLHLGQLAWQFHERVFRGGRRSGQRAIAGAIDKLTRSGRYELLVDEPTLVNARLRVWVSREVSSGPPLQGSHDTGRPRRGLQPSARSADEGNTVTAREAP